MQPLNRKKYIPTRAHAKTDQPQSRSILVCTIAVLICNVVLIVGSIAFLRNKFSATDNGRTFRGVEHVPHRLNRLQRQVAAFRQVHNYDDLKDVYPALNNISTVAEAERVEATWLTEALSASNELQRRNTKRLKTAVRALIAATDDSSTTAGSNSSNMMFDVQDAKAMVLSEGCSPEESLAAEATADKSDCSLLHKEYEMCHAINSPSSTGSDGRTFGDLQKVRTPHAQGFIKVEGLEDPLAVMAAMYDEARRIGERAGEQIAYPIAATKAVIDGEGDVARKFTLDIVYTEVDFTEPSFQADRFSFRDKVPPDLNKRNSPSWRMDSLKKLRAAELSAVQATLVLPHVWSSIAGGALGESLSQDLETAGNSTANTSMLSPLRDMNSDLVSRFESASKTFETKLSDSVDEPFRNLPRALHSLFRLNSDSVNRFRNFNELRYSMRGLFRNIISPMEEAVRLGKGRVALGKIFIVVSHRSQAPPWLKASPYIELVEHRDLFPDPRRSLPTFNSRAIESVLHRIKGLSRHYIYLNNDFMLARPVSFFDFFQPIVLWESGTNTSPTVRWLPALQSCAVHFGGWGGDKRWKSSLAPKELHTVQFIGRMIGSDALGFAATFSHIPQMYDKLQVMRMLTEPSIRGIVCGTRGSRQRSEDNIPTMYAYQHFALLWRHGWGPKAARRAVLSLFPQEYNRHMQKTSVEPFMDSLGRRSSLLWNYLHALHRATDASGAVLGNMSIDDRLYEDNSLAAYPSGLSKQQLEVLEALSPILATMAGLVDTHTEGTITLPVSSLLAHIQERRSDPIKYDRMPSVIHVNANSRAEGSLKTYDHWLVDLYRHLKQPLITLAESEKAFFGMAEDVPRTQHHIEVMQRLQGKVLFVTENDDLPPGSRAPSSSGIFSQLSQMAIGLLCSWPRSTWVNAATSHMLAIGFESEDGNKRRLHITANESFVAKFPSAESEDPFMQVLFGDTRMLQPSAYRGRLRERVALRGRAQMNRFGGDRGKRKRKSWRGGLGNSGNDSPIISGPEVGFQIADRIQCACALEASHNAVLSAEIAAGTYQPPTIEESSADGLYTPNSGSASCEDGPRYLLQSKSAAARAFFHEYEIPTTILRQDFGAVRRRRERKGPPLDTQPTPIPTVRHNCSVVPLPWAEVPPSSDVYAADLFLDVIRTAVGDCDSQAPVPMPPWEITGC